MGRTPDSELNCNVSSESLARAGGPSPDRPAGKDELQWSDGERIETGADDDQLPVRPQSIHQGRDRFRIWRGGENHAGAAQGLQRGGWRAGVGVNVMVSAQFLDQRFFVSAAADRDRAESHLARVLNSQVTQSADALHRHQFVRQSLRNGAAS